MKFYSQVSNNNRISDSGVSHQTGQYSHTAHLCTLSSVDPTGDHTERDFSLSYSINSAVPSKTPYGAGWSLNGISSFVSGESITLSNGQQFAYSHMNSSTVNFHDQKLQDIKVTYQSKEDAYIVQYKDGVVETLHVAGFKKYMMSTMTFPNGEAYSFYYNQIGNEPVLRSVTDARGVEVFSLDYTQYNTLSCVSVWRGNGYAQAFFSVQYFSDHNRLVNMTRFVPASSKTDIGLIKFSYANIFGYWCIDNIHYPEGAFEKVTHDGRGHMIATPSGVHEVPRTQYFISHAGNNSEAITETFRYPGADDSYSNFLGYPNKYDWHDNLDNLYAWASKETYSYWVEVTTAENSPNMFTTKYTYNTFHLQTKELTTRGSCQIETEFEYPCDLPEYQDKAFQEQPHNFQLPTRVSRITKKGAQTTSPLVTVKKTDIYGNEIESIAPSGLKRVVEYYPVRGERGKCPADPFGSFQRFLKTTKTCSSDGKLFKEKTFEYASLKPLSYKNQRIPAVVKANRLILRGSDGMSGVMKIFHIEKPDSYFLHNRIQRNELTYENDGVTSGTTVSDMTFQTFEDMDERVKTVTTLTGYDGTSFSSSETYRCYSNLLLESVDRNGVRATATYDIAGQVLSTTSAAGTAQEETVTYEHYHNHPEANCPTVDKTNEGGVKTRICYDGANNLVSVSRAFDDKTSSKLYTFLYQKYNEVGDCVEREMMDYHPNGKKLFSEKTEMKYDEWGQLSESRIGATTEVIKNDPFTRTRTTQTIARLQSGKVVSSASTSAVTYNTFRLPIKKEILRGNAENITSQTEYDGLGRLTKLISPLGNTISVLQYDLVDRVTKVRNQEGAIFDITYSPHLADKDMTSYSVSDSAGNKVILGEQEFDGIGRLTRKTVGGYSTHFSFDGSSEYPSQVLTPGGNTVSTIYNAILTGLPNSITSSVGSGKANAKVQSRDSFFYGTSRAMGNLTNLVHAANENAAFDASYTSFGRLSSMNQQIAGGKELKVSYSERSLLGRPISTEFTMRDDEKDKTAEPTKISHEYSFDGRIKTIKQSGVSVEYTYDIMGKLKVELVKGPDGRVKQEMQRNHDNELDVERMRSISTFVNGKEEQYTVSYDHDIEKKLKSRTHRMNNRLQREESFQYDECDRMIVYRKREYHEGHTARSTEERYTFDMSNNVTKVKTIFEDGKEDIATWLYEKGGRKPISITHTLTTHFPSKISFTYDADGNMIEISTPEETISMEYSVTGRLLRYADSHGHVEEFKYDAFQRVVSDGSCHKYYMKNQLLMEYGWAKGEGSIEFIRQGSQVIAEKSNRDIMFIGRDADNSAIISHSSTGRNYQSYGAYGVGSPTSRTGYTGAVTQRHSPIYLLGDGTRVYFPKYRMFTSMDTFSPFSEGGIHPYQYCGANPINSIDPNGRLFGLNLFCLIVDVVVLAFAAAAVVATGGAAVPVVAALGATFGVVSDTLGVAADSLAIYDKNHGTDHSEKIRKLGVASTSFGVAGFAADIGAGLSASVKTIAASRKLMKRSMKSFDNSVSLKKGADNLLGETKHLELRENLLKLSDEAFSRGKRLHKAAEKAKSRKLIAKKSGTSMIESTTGLDFSKVKRVLNPPPSRFSGFKRTGYGIWGLSEVGSTAGAYYNNITGIQAIAEDENPEGYDGLSNTLATMMDEKYPFV